MKKMLIFGLLLTFMASCGTPEVETEVGTETTELVVETDSTECDSTETTELEVSE
jgi:hypothetical protein